MQDHFRFISNSKMTADSVDRTLFVGNLSRKVTDMLLHELFLQAGPLVKVHIPEDKATGEKKNFAFVEFKHAESVPFTIQLMEGLALYGQTLHLQTRSGSSHSTPTQQTQAPMSAPHDVAGLRRSQLWNQGDYDRQRGGSPQFPRNGPSPLLQKVVRGGLPVGQAVLQGLQVGAMPGMDPNMDPRRDRILRQQGLMIAAHQQRSGHGMANRYGGGMAPHHHYNHPGNYRHGGGGNHYPHDHSRSRHRPY